MQIALDRIQKAEAYGSVMCSSSQSQRVHPCSGQAHEIQEEVYSLPLERQGARREEVHRPCGDTRGAACRSVEYRRPHGAGTAT